MCLEDYQIWRQLRSNYYSGEGSITVPANPMRTTLIVNASLGDLVRVIAPQQPFYGGNGSGDITIAIIAAGFLVTVSEIITSPSVLRLADYGEALLGTLNIVSQGGAKLTAVETYLNILTPFDLTTTQLAK